MTSRSSSSVPSRSLPRRTLNWVVNMNSFETALGVVEVEEADGARCPAPGARRPVQGHPEGQVLVNGLVPGHAHGIDVLQLEDDPVGLKPR